MPHLAGEPTTSTSSFSIDGELQLGFFANSEDKYHSRINGERIETVIARMMGFPSEEEFDAALAAGLSSDSSQPDIVKTLPRISISVFVEGV